MIADGVEDEEKWLAAGIAGLQQNAFYMHRALVTLFSIILLHLNWLKGSVIIRGNLYLL